MIGGGKYPNSKNNDSQSKLPRGSKYFKGDLLCQYPCFSFNGKHLSPVTQVDQFVSFSFELLGIVPQGQFERFRSQADLVCLVPVSKILNSLTKDVLSSLPYVSNNLICRKVSRVAVIADIEQNLLSYDTEDYNSMFKFHKARSSKKIFPAKDNQLKEIHMDHYAPNSSSVSVEESMCDNMVTPDEHDLLHFPPEPLSEKLQHKVIANYCKNFELTNFHESGCAVCGALAKINTSVPISC